MHSSEVAAAGSEPRFPHHQLRPARPGVPAVLVLVTAVHSACLVHCSWRPEPCTLFLPSARVLEGLGPHRWGKGARELRPHRTGPGQLSTLGGSALGALFGQVVPGSWGVCEVPGCPRRRVGGGGREKRPFQPPLCISMWTTVYNLSFPEVSSEEAVFLCGEGKLRRQLLL